MRRSSLLLFKIVSLFTALAIFVIPQCVFSQVSTQKYFIGEVIKLHSKILNEERTILVYLPDGYSRTTIKYPVLYLLDGDAHFHHVSGIAQFLAARGLSPQILIIALSNTDRTRDFSPTKVEDRPTSGGADNFLKFMKNELIPFVDTNYRAYPFRILAGHSLCGLFTIYTLFTMPDIFEAYIAISPYLVYDDGYLLKNAESFLEKNPALKKSLFMAVGNEPRIISSIQTFSEILENKAPKSLEWKYVRMEEEDHATVTHKGFYTGLTALYPDWRLPEDLAQMGLESLKAHFESLSKRYGYNIPIPANAYNGLGYQLIEQKKIPDAIQALRLCIVTYPDYWLAYHNLGYCYMVLGDRELAIENFEKTLQLNPDNKLAAGRLKKLKERK